MIGQTKRGLTPDPGQPCEFACQVVNDAQCFA
jgi:hypothetical protein